MRATLSRRSHSARACCQPENPRWRGRRPSSLALSTLCLTWVHRCGRQQAEGVDSRGWVWRRKRSVAARGCRCARSAIRRDAWPRRLSRPAALFTGNFRFRRFRTLRHVFCDFCLIQIRAQFATSKCLAVPTPFICPGNVCDSLVLRTNSTWVHSGEKNQVGST